MSPARKGPISQRDLVKVLVPLIDDAMAGNSTAHRDIARSRIRAILDDPASNWRTSFLGNNLSSRRVRYLASLGYYFPSRWMLREWGRPDVG